MFAFRIALILSYLVLRRSLRRSRPAIHISLALPTLGLIKLTQLSPFCKRRGLHCSMIVHDQKRAELCTFWSSSARFSTKRAEFCTFGTKTCRVLHVFGLYDEAPCTATSVPSTLLSHSPQTRGSMVGIASSSENHLHPYGGREVDVLISIPSFFYLSEGGMDAGVVGMTRSFSM